MTSNIKDLTSNIYHLTLSFLRVKGASINQRGIQMLAEKFQKVEELLPVKSQTLDF